MESSDDEIIDNNSYDDYDDIEPEQKPQKKENIKVKLTTKRTDFLI